MKTTKLTVCLLLIATPILLRADPQTDRNIERAAAESYNYRTMLEDHVKVKADDGKVTLTGTVADEDQRTLAENTVRELPGVVSIDNKIKIDKEPHYSDGWVATKIRTKLLLSANVSAVGTDVSVKDGVVTLTGKADNMAQKELTGAYVAEVAGVKKVDNQIEVPKPPSDERTLSDRIDDASITAQVKYELLAHESTSAFATSVTTKDGVVHVKGKADSAAERALVTHLASKVPGVKSVRNEMTVKG